MLFKTRAGMRLSLSLLSLALLLQGAGTAWAGGSSKDKKKAEKEASVSYTPMPLDSGYGPMDISDPPITPEAIIAKFTEKESAFREALNHYTYRRTVKVETIDDNGKPDGEYYEVDDIIFDPSGQTDGEGGLRAGQQLAADQHVARGFSGYSDPSAFRSYQARCRPI